MSGGLMNGWVDEWWVDEWVGRCVERTEHTA